MNHEVGVPADRRGEVAVDLSGQSEVPRVHRVVPRLPHGAQRDLADQRVLGPPLHLFDQALDRPWLDRLVDQDVRLPDGLVVGEDPELDARRARQPKLPAPDSQTPWQDIFREKVRPFSEGMTLKGADAHKDIARKHIPRDNH